MRIGGQPIARHLEPEVVELLLGEAALHERSGVDTGRSVSLEVHLITGRSVVLAVEEVIEANLVEGGRAGVSGEMAADRGRTGVGSHHHDGGVPTDVCPDAALDVLVAGKLGLAVGGDGIDIRRGHAGGKVDILCPGLLEQPHQQVSGPGPAVSLHHVVESVHPLGRLPCVNVVELLADTVEEHAPMLSLVRR